MARKIIPGNRIYTIYRAFPEIGKIVKIVALNNAQARKFALTKLNIDDAHYSKYGISVSWDIHNGNRGITNLPIGTVIYPKKGV